VNVEPTKIKTKFAECGAYKLKPMVEIMLLDAANSKAGKCKP
jgi:hypothetical protein